MAVQIPSFIEKAPPGHNPNAPMPGGSHPKSGGLRAVLFIAAIVILGGAAAYYFLIMDNEGGNENENLLVVSNQSNTNAQTNQNANTNINSNINTNRNSNTTSNTSNTSNVNLNRNLNTNVNTFSNNLNQNLNSNLNINTDTTFKLNNTVITPAIIDNEDTDGDGLTNNDEYLYGTDASIIDTDGDGYDDYTEVMACYNPSGDGELTGQFFNNFCIKLLNQEKDTWGSISSTQISQICSFYEPAVSLNIQQFLEDNYSEKQFDELLNEGCNQLQSIVNESADQEDVLCTYMALISMVCI